MTTPGAPGAQRWAVPTLLSVVALLIAAPVGVGFATGITKDNAGLDAFGADGCTACHGPTVGGQHQFAQGGPGIISMTFTDADGNQPAGNVYNKASIYTVHIALDEQVNAAAPTNHAGFNLRASVGKLSGVEGQSQHSTDQSQATHVGPNRTDWNVMWEAPAEGVVVFDLFVNDVDGSGSPDDGDNVHRIGFYLMDETHTLPGAAAHEPEFGITLQQYWIGLIGLAGMIFIMVAGFVYLKLVNPHNTDAKDR